MELQLIEQRIINYGDVNDGILAHIHAFMIDKNSQGLSAKTLGFYQQKLLPFARWCHSHDVNMVEDITPALLRNYLLHLERTGHNEGGRHAYYRSIRVWLRWYENEVEPPNWKNPINKVKAPRLPIEPIEPITIKEFECLLKAASLARMAERDRAILYTLLDTGARAAEFLSLNLADVNIANGAILIRKGKGGKPRTVFIGKKTRRTLRAYVRTRTDDSDALWITTSGGRLTQSGLRQVLKRLAARAGITEHGAHDFRRAFALNMLRNGCDIFTLARLMGHSSIQVLQRYLAQTTADTEAAAARFGVVDKL